MKLIVAASLFGAATAFTTQNAGRSASALSAEKS
eukprot:CAMPEP_0172457018 /NCGR_PEP_ID=MMETSP1065-20121228/19336_1 /TAXON_ID=265537 /ORGANISM="Amphiprora paludosa, Strain CCMP125" /LENGTH=33 /DNA_ID= /DNA_START= /DNA_END= /DNA_ORIENTATION=